MNIARFASISPFSAVVKGMILYSRSAPVDC